MKRFTRRWGCHLLCLAIMTWVGGETTWGAGSEIWGHRTRAEREQGDLNGVTLLEDGSLTLGLALTTLGRTAEPYVWALARDSSGNLYVGTGDEGRVYRLDPEGKLELFFDSEELAVHALVTDEKGRLYVGTSPDGKIYRLSPAGEWTVFSSPKATYIWSLVFDEKENLYAATGNEGKIYKIDPEGNAEVWADTDEIHIRSMIRHPRGGLLAGTDGTGLVLHIDPEGDVKVVTQSPLTEVTSLAADRNGRIYFSTVGRGTRVTRRRSTPAGENAASTAAAHPAESDEPPPGPPPVGPERTPPSRPPAPPSRPAGPPLQSRVVVVEREGQARELWSGEGELVLSVAADAAGGVIAGSGTAGKVFRIQPDDDRIALINRADSDQITVLLAGPRGEFWIGGSNLGAVYRLGSEAATRGTYLSASHDAEVTSTWGTIAWRGETPEGTDVYIRVRTGDAPEPDGSWSNWSKPYRDAAGSTITAPAARYLQWEATLSSKGRAVPRLGEVRISFRQRNLPPEVTSVTIREPGVVFQEPTPARAARGPGNSGRGAGRPEGAGGNQRAPQSPRTQPDHDGRAVEWDAADPNGDQLLYSVYYRGIDEREWKPMKEDFTDSFLSWDASSMADGTYVLRVVADDSASNSEETALSRARLSDPFDIDNNPPRFGPFETDGSGSSVRTRFQVSDSFSPVVGVQYSVNAGVWRDAYPVDGVADSQRESFEVFLKGLSPGEYTVVFKATDAVGNTSTAKTVFTNSSSP